MNPQIISNTDASCSRNEVPMPNSTSGYLARSPGTKVDMTAPATRPGSTTFRSAFDETLTVRLPSTRLMAL